jgi:sulfur carrier protein ThiS
MKIRLSYSKLIKVEKYVNDSMIEVPDACTVRDVIALLGLPGYRQKSLLVIVNNEPVWNSTVLKENDLLKLLPLVAGG